MTVRSPALVVCLACKAESAVTTPARNGKLRARSTTVLATEVTGIPDLVVT
jgi:hypothetical protein